MEVRLTEKQELFSVAMFTIGSLSFGNGTESARKAGYGGTSPTDNYLGRVASENVRKCSITARKEQIQADSVEVYNNNRTDAILNRVQRQEFWTKVIEDEDTTMPDKLRASELLGRSEADFTDNVNSTNKTLSINVQSKES